MEAPDPAPEPGTAAYRAAQRADLLRFAAGSWHRRGFGWLDDVGDIDPTRPVALWITCRMTHVFALGLLADEAPAPGGPDRAALQRLAGHGVQALRGSLADDEHGGWFAAVDGSAEGSADDEVVDPGKQSYGHAFVTLAASSAAAAGIDGAGGLLADALAIQQQRFWDEDAGLVVDAWDRSWSELDGYRGLNANMHTVEAFLAAGDVTGDRVWHQRAARIASRAVAWARVNGWRLPEHFDSSWTPVLDHHRDQPAHPFQPFGATVGHGLEWARLLVAVEGAVGSSAAPGCVDAAIALADRAVADGWAVDGADGFVYTTDWDGTPVVRTRMHWVAAEAVNTAETLRRVTGEVRYAENGRRWWAYVDEHLVDRLQGSWRHELDVHNRPSAEVWAGKPDVYHAYQAALLPELPTSPSFAAALASRGRLGS